MGIHSNNEIGGQYIYVTKPLRYISYSLTAFCTIGIISSTIACIFENSFSIIEMIIIDFMFISGLFVVHYYTENVMRYYLFPYSLQVPNQFVYPKGNSQIIAFNRIIEIENKKQQYTLVDVSGIKYVINPAFNNELIPRMKSILGERWDDLYNER